MEILVKILQFLFSLSLLVFVHELGHFTMAKIFKVRVEKFYIFFNPWFSLFKFRKGETEYGMGWVPLGGYVKISGMIDESMDLEQMKEPAKPYEFRAKPAWQRLFIMIGGVLVNFIFAFFLYILILYTWGEKYLPAENVKYGVVVDSLFTNVGVQTGDIIISLDHKKIENFGTIVGDIVLDGPKTMQLIRDGRTLSIDLPASLQKALLAESSKGFDRKNYIAPRFRYEGVIEGFGEKSPAKEAGMLETDRILSLAGQTFAFYDEYVALIKAHKEQILLTQVLRGSDTILLRIPIGEDGLMGVFPRPIDDFEYAVKDYTFAEAIPAGIHLGSDKIASYIKQFKLFKDPEAIKSLGGFISIGNIFPGYWSWIDFWYLTALLSLVLGIMNLLPIPALDGGHVLFLLYEMITRRKPSDKFMENAQVVGMLFILLLLLVANGNDIIKLFR